MNEKYCDKLLNHLQNNTNERKEFKFRPKILCVGKNKTMNYEIFYTPDSKSDESVWAKLDKNFIEENSDIVKKIYKLNQLDLDEDGNYVTSVGTCKGDSGGPAFARSNFN